MKKNICVLFLILFMLVVQAVAYAAQPVEIELTGDNATALKNGYKSVDEVFSFEQKKICNNMAFLGDDIDVELSKLKPKSTIDLGIKSKEIVIIWGAKEGDDDLLYIALRRKDKNYVLIQFHMAEGDMRIIDPRINKKKVNEFISENCDKKIEINGNEFLSNRRNLKLTKYD